MKALQDLFENGEGEDADGHRWPTIDQCTLPTPEVVEQWHTIKPSWPGGDGPKEKATEKEAPEEKQLL